jgi:hypothetical protein
MKPGAFVGPSILIVMGVLFLLNNFGLTIPIGDFLRYGWPFLLILIGVLQLAGALGGRGSLPAGLILITIGSLFAFDRLLGVSFSHTWPVILIAAGVIGLLRTSAGAAFGGRRSPGGFMR